MEEPVPTQTYTLAKEESKSLMREAAKYAFFLLLFTLTAVIARTNDDVYHQSAAIRAKLCQASLPPEEKILQSSFSDIALPSDVFQYLRSTFPLALFTDYYDSPFFLNADTASLTEQDLKTGSVGNNTRLIGRVIVRQVRVTSGGCRGPRLSGGTPCYASISDAPSLSQDAFGPNKRWKFSAVGQGSYWGASGSFYPEQGHRIILPRAYHEFRSEIDYLQSNGFIDSATRAIFVDAILYNQAFGLYTMVRLVFEYHETGSVTTMAQIATYRFDLYTTPLDSFVAFMEIVVALSIPLFLYEEVSELLKSGAREYFSSFFNFLDFAKIFSLAAIVVLRVMFLLLYNSINLKLLDADKANAQVTALSSTDSGDFPELELRSAASIYQSENVAISLTVLIMYCKIFKYFELSAGLSEFSRTLEGAAPHLKRFLIVVVISLSGFSLFGHFAFGTQFVDYSSLLLSLIALMRGLFGDMPSNTYYKVDRVFGPLFFLMYQLFAQFIFLEHFLTYVAESYFELKNYKYEVEFGVIDAIARFTTILKQKVGRAPITEKGDANVNGANQDSNSAKSGDGGGNSGAQNISAKEVLAAEQALDKALAMVKGGMGESELYALICSLRLFDSKDTKQLASAIMDSITGSGTGLRRMFPDDLFVVRHIVVGSLHRVVKQQRIQELTDILLQIDETVSMMSDVMLTIATMTCDIIRYDTPAAKVSRLHKLKQKFDHLSATGGGAAAPGVQNADAAKSPKLPAVPEEKLNRLPRTLRRKLQAQMQFEEPPN